MDVGGTANRPVGPPVPPAPGASGVFLLLRYFSTIHELGLAAMASDSRPPLTNTASRVTPAFAAAAGF